MTHINWQNIENTIYLCRIYGLMTLISIAFKNCMGDKDLNRSQNNKWGNQRIVFFLEKHLRFVIYNFCTEQKDTVHYADFVLLTCSYVYINYNLH